MANRTYSDSDNPNWPSRTGEPSGKGRGTTRLPKNNSRLKASTI